MRVSSDGPFWRKIVYPGPIKQIHSFARQCYGSNRTSTRGKKVKAHHEAGHAVIARVLGINVSHVALHSVGLQNGSGVLRHSALHLANGKDPATQIIAAENDAKILLAGPIAQCFYRPLTEGQKRKEKHR